MSLKLSLLRQNSFDNIARETDVAEELRELQRLIGVYSGETGPELARNYVELERSLDREDYCEQPSNHCAGACYGTYGGQSLTEEYGTRLFHIQVLCLLIPIAISVPAS